FPWLPSVRYEYRSLANECEQRQDYLTAANYYRRLLSSMSCEEDTKDAAEERRSTLSDLLHVYEKMAQFDAANELQYLLQQEGLKIEGTQKFKISKRCCPTTADISLPQATEKLSDLDLFQEFPLHAPIDSMVDSMPQAILDGGVFLL